MTTDPDAPEPEFDTEASVACPYCGQVNWIAVDPAGGSHQEYVEDCQVCCRPWQVSVTFGDDGAATVSADSTD